MILPASVFTLDHLYYFGAGAVAIALLLSSLAVAKENIRDEFYQPARVFVVNLNFFARRRKIAKMFETVETSQKLLEEIRHQVLPNSGGSLKDQVTRIESAVGESHSKLDYAMDKFRFQDDCARDLLFETDEKAHLTYANRALCETLGVEEKDLLGKKWLNSIVHSERERVQREWREAIENKIPLESVQTVARRHAADETFEIRVCAKPVTDAGGSIVRFFGVVTIR